MKIRRQYLIGAFLLLAWLMVATLSVAQAQSGGGYDLTWNTQESGGPAASGGSYSLSGNFGQPEASAELSSGGYSLAGGFWSGIRAYLLSLPVVLK